MTPPTNTTMALVQSSRQQLLLCVSTSLPMFLPGGGVGGEVAPPPHNLAELEPAAPDRLGQSLHQLRVHPCLTHHGRAKVIRVACPTLIYSACNIWRTGA